MRRIVWTVQARADVRGLDKATAMRVLQTLDRFARSGLGDVKILQGEPGQLRLRAGDYRLFFIYLNASTIQRKRVRHRSEAYR